MKDRTSGIIMRTAAILAVFAAWVSVSRLLATWMSNHLVLINGPISAEYGDECTSARSYYSNSWSAQSLPTCEPTGYEYGRGIYPAQDHGMPTSSFFGEVYTDGWGIVITLVLGAVALAVLAFVIIAIIALFDGIINGFGSQSDPCDVGQCDCNCKCCRQRKRRYEASRQSSSNMATGIAVGTAIGISIGS